MFRNIIFKTCCDHAVFKSLHRLHILFLEQFTSPTQKGFSVPLSVFKILMGMISNDILPY